MSNWRKQLDYLSVIASTVRETASEPVSAEVHTEGRDRLVGAAQTDIYAAPRRRRMMNMLAFAAALTVASAAFLAWPRPLRYEVRGGSGLDGPYVSASPVSPVELQFSDGSSLHGEPGSRLRVDETYRNGARVFLERGSTTSRVTHNKASNWTFVAGPFEVHVTGTRFALAWDPLMEEVDLQLLEGSVEVRSPLVEGPIPVRAGQRFRAAVASRSMMVTEGDSAAPSALPEQAPKVVTSEPAVVAPPAVTNSKATPPRRDASWQELLAHGEFESIVSSATARGLDACIAGCSAPDLRSLADAARYTSRGTLAERCLLALRQRFPTGLQSSAAAFMLGRTHESRGQASTAQRWYETYLSESPDGEFAAEALAGKMRAVTTISGSASAKPLALEYLRRYPQGVHVKTARKIAGLD